MPIVGAYILPHGALILTPFKNPEMKDLKILNKSMYNVAEEVYLLQPDLIILTTPHGISLTRSFGVYLNESAEGNAEWEGNWSEFKVKVEIAEEESKEILNCFTNSGICAEGIISYSTSETIPLRWGEVIPLWFLLQPYLNYSMKPRLFPKCIIVTMPRKRLTEPELMIEECLKLGKEIFEYFNKSDKKVVIITSGDLAHIHTVNMKTITQEFSDDADIFDQTIQLWAMNPIENEQVLLDAAKLVMKYLSCGYTGFLVLQGILKECKNIVPNVLCNLHPTYYGMMVAKFKILK